jgi:hypothetical protein
MQGKGAFAVLRDDQCVVPRLTYARSQKMHNPP